MGGAGGDKKKIEGSFQLWFKKSNEAVWEGLWDYEVSPEGFLVDHTTNLESINNTEAS